MISELQSLYQEVILDHYKRPRNTGKLAAPDRQAEGYNPLCGDRVRVEVALAGDVIQDVRVHCTGCAISVAAASLMSEAIKGKTLAQAAALFDAFHALVTGAAGTNGGGPVLGKLAVFAGVSRYPARVKCAILPWHAVKAALANKPEPVCTE